KVRAWTDFSRPGFRRKVMLPFRKKEKRGNRLAGVLWEIAGIFGNAYDFVLAGPHTISAEMLSEWIFIPEKLPCKRLINHRNVPRSRRILLGDTASSKDRSSDDV